MTWLYVFSVRLIWLCPRVSITTRAGTPWLSSSDAQAWRRSWKRCWGRPAACEDPLEPAGHADPIDRCAHPRREHEVTEASERGLRWTRHRGSFPVGEQPKADDRREGHDPAARGRLRLDEGKLALDPLEGPTHPERAGLEIEVPPGQTQDLALAQATAESDEIEGFPAFTF